MIVTKKIVRTYVVQMTEQQAKDLIKVSALAVENDDDTNKLTDLGNAGVEVLNDLRLSLLNG